MALPKPRSVPAVVLYDGDDQEQLALLKRAADQAVFALDQATQEAATPNTRGGGVDLSGLREKADEAKAAFDAFVDECADRALEVRVRPIGRTPFRELMQAHPPRMVESDPDAEGKTRQIVHHDDEGYEVDTETFPMALLLYCDDHGSTIEAPVFDDEAGLQHFLDRDLTEGDFEQVWVTAYAVNRNPSADPSRFRFSVESQSSTETDA